MYGVSLQVLGIGWVPKQSSRTTSKPGEGAGALYESLPHKAQATGKRCSWAIVSALGLADDRCHMNRKPR